MTAIEPIADKLSKLIPLLGSPVDGEALSAVRAIDRTLKSAGSDWHDLASALNSRPGATKTAPTPKPKPPPPPEPIDRAAVMTMARAVAEASRSTDWEREFAASIASRLERGSRLTGKQQRCLRRIYHKVTSE